jgi:hypothetical protein
MSCDGAVVESLGRLKVLLHAVSSSHARWASRSARTTSPLRAELRCDC